MASRAFGFLAPRAGSTPIFFGLFIPTSSANPNWSLDLPLVQASQSHIPSFLGIHIHHHISTTYIHTHSWISLHISTYQYPTIFHNSLPIFAPLQPKTMQKSTAIKIYGTLRRTAALFTLYFPLCFYGILRLWSQTTMSIPKGSPEGSIPFFSLQSHRQDPRGGLIPTCLSCCC